MRYFFALVSVICEKRRLCLLINILIMVSLYTLWLHSLEPVLLPRDHFVSRFLFSPLIFLISENAEKNDRWSYKKINAMKTNQLCLYTNLKTKTFNCNIFQSLYFCLGYFDYKSVSVPDIAKIHTI
jgi:hypothetical protein